MKDNYIDTEDNITLKDIIHTVKKYIFEVIRLWWVIALIAIPMSMFMAYKAIYKPITYTANNRFIIEGNSSGSLGGLGGILGSFIGSDKKINAHQILEVARSSAILDEVLLDTMPGTKKMVANEILEKYELDKIWMEINPKFENFRFKTTDKSKWERLDQKAYKKLINFTIGSRRNRGNAIYRVIVDDDSGIYSISCVTIDHNISYHLSNSIFFNLKYFFEEKVLKTQFQTRELLKTKRDSLKNLIDIKSRELAQFEDSNRNSILSSSSITKGKILNEIGGLSIAYQEIFKNYEIADFSYKDKKPYFMLIDTPMIPLSPVGGVLLLNLIIALILAGIIGVAFIILRKIYLEAMAE
jgi:hypothetical protein